MRSATLLPALLLAAVPAIAAAPASHPAGHHGLFCVNDSHFENPVPLPDGTVLLQGRPSREKSYVAVFKGGPCPDMHIDSTLVIERDGGQYCEGDKVRAFEPGDIIAGRVCIIDHFEPYVPSAHGDRRKPF